MVAVDETVGNHLQTGLEARGAAFLGVEIVRRIDSALPFEPELARTRSVQVVLDDEPHLTGEYLCSRANEQMMIGMLHHRLRNERRRANTFQCSDTTGALLRAVHTAGVELDDTISVRQATKAHARVFRISLHDIDACDHGVEGIGSADEKSKGLFDTRSIAAVLEPIAVA